LRLWLKTLRVRIACADTRKHPADPVEQRYIYAFWHEALLAPAVVRAKVHVLISHHMDGQVIAEICRHLGIGVVRGSTKRGGGEALLQLLARSQDTHLVMTPDGPRGPRRRVQLGTIFLASRSGLPIVPLGVGYAHAWRAGSWDRLAVPWPGSIVTGVILAPIVVPPDLDREALEHYRCLLEERLLTATETAEKWAATSPIPTQPDLTLAAVGPPPRSPEAA
jgi:lysophospholipid acyltransferase (LPLAT)-like uncharacterized protein